MHIRLWAAPLHGSVVSWATSEDSRWDMSPHKLWHCENPFRSTALLWNTVPMRATPTWKLAMKDILKEHSHGLLFICEDTRQKNSRRDW